MIDTNADAASLPPEVATPDQPVESGERIASLDFIRGIAVLGIVFANIVAFAQPMLAAMWPPAMVQQPYSQADAVTWVVQLIAVDGKFRGLFTILFGAGMMLFMERAWARGSSRWLQFRRLFWLLVFGSVHYFFIWRGDILSVYAVWGMACLFAMTWEIQTKFVSGLVAAISGAMLTALTMGISYMVMSSPEMLAALPEADREQIMGMAPMKIDLAGNEAALMAGDSWLAIVRDTIFNHGYTYAIELAWVGLMETFGWIMLGMALFQMGLFNGGIPAATLKKWGWIGVILGSLLTVPLAMWVYNSDFDFSTTLFVAGGLAGVPRIPAVLGLLALLAAYAPSLSSGWLGQRISAAGRAAFTNYLGTSIVMVLIFQGWAGGLFGQFGRLELFGFVLGAWAVMLAWSKPWLERYRYGPLEWLWRCLTYGRLFPLKR